MKSGLYSIFLRRLGEIKTKKEIISFPLVFEKICSTFSIKKQDCWEVLFLLRDTGFIEIIAGHSIKILNEEVTKSKESKLLARDIPKTCVNECRECYEKFEAKIRIACTCEPCLEEENKLIDEKLKDYAKEDWAGKLLALVKNSNKK